MSKRILMEHGKRIELIKMFNTTYPTVSNALKGTTYTELAKKIRKAALEMGGAES